MGEVDFFACGLSIVIHPKNPMAPTVHANCRYFEMYDTNKNCVDQWFGGGLDLTPYYLFNEDSRHFHEQCKKLVTFIILIFIIHLKKSVIPIFTTNTEKRQEV